MKRAGLLALVGLAVWVPGAEARLTSGQVDRLVEAPALRQLMDADFAVLSAIPAEADDGFADLTLHACNHRPGLYRCPLPVWAHMRDGGTIRCKVWVRATGERWRSDRDASTCPSDWLP